MNMTPKRANGRIVPLVFAVLLLIAAAGRAVSCASSAVATDIAYPDWAASLVSYLAEITAALRIAVGLGAVAWSAYARGRWGDMTAAALCAALLDYAARFLIDLLTGALGEYAVLALAWLGQEFLLEVVLTLIAVPVILGTRKKFRAAANPRERAGYTPYRAAAYAVLLHTALRLGLEIYNAADFLLTYAGITSAEAASIVGSILRVLVIYGALSVLAAAATVSLLGKRRGRAAAAGKSGKN